MFNDDTDSSKDKDNNIKNKDINLLKRETISPIENVQNMQILSEDKAIYKIIKSLYEISEQMCKD